MNEVKIGMIGAGAVGKSCLTVQFIRNEFLDTYDPTVEDIHRKEIYTEDGETIEISIIDTSGLNEYVNVMENAIKNCEGFMIVYSITDKRSFGEIQHFVDKIMSIKEKKVPLILVATKADLEEDREVEFKQGKELAQKLKIPFFEISSKYPENIKEIFKLIIKDTYKSMKKAGLISTTEDHHLKDIPLNSPPKKQNKTCVVM
ncbi:hypothetical protein ABK040_007191 [Willaertia magna]